MYPLSCLCARYPRSSTSLRQSPAALRHPLILCQLRACLSALMGIFNQAQRSRRVRRSFWAPGAEVGTSALKNRRY